MEWNTSRVRLQAARILTWEGPRPHQVGEPTHLVDGEPVEIEAIPAIGDLTQQPFREVEDGVGTADDHGEQRGAPQPTEREGDRLQGELVGPLGVVHDHHEQLLAIRLGPQHLEHRGTRSQRIRGTGGEELEEYFGLGTTGLAGELLQHSSGEWLLVGVAGHGQHPDLADARPMADERRLADS